MAESGGFRDELVVRLKYLIELRGKSVAQVERELGRSRGFLGDALRGGKRLTLETIVEVLELLQVEPARFFAGAVADDRRWGAYASHRSVGGEVAEGKVGVPMRWVTDNLDDGSIEVGEVARALGAVVRLLEEKGYLSGEELGRALGSRASDERS